MCRSSYLYPNAGAVANRHGNQQGSRIRGTVCVSDLRVQYVISDLRVQYQGVRETSTENQGTVCIPDLRVQYGIYTYTYIRNKHNIQYRHKH